MTTSSPEPSSHSATPTHLDELPLATVSPAATMRFPGTNLSRLAWLAAFLALGVAIGAVIISQAGRGPEVRVRFQEGHGIKVGDAVRHRGIDVGEVTDVALSDGLEGVVLRIRLYSHAAGIAREGTRFWIQRPRLSLGAVSGLDTVLGAKYVAVLPGSPSARAAYSFDGVESPLLMSGSDEVNVTIRFAEGHGITIGSPVRYRGVEVGEVVAFDFEPGLRGLNVGIRLVRGAEQFARTGSQFWIERPNLSLTAVRGLDTILGGPYIAVQPGSIHAERCLAFDGLDVPPAAMIEPGDGIEFLLVSGERRSLERAAPISYRGVQIGQVLTVGLSADARQVEARAFVYAPYHELLRDNTQFWSYGGMDLSLGLTGLSLNLDNLATVAAGGIALGTPDPPGASIHSGHRYSLQDEAPNNWSDWSPRIPVSSPLLQPATPLPSLQRALLTWRTRRLGIPRTQRRMGWVLPLENGTWLVPTSLAQPEDNALDDSSVLEVAGVRIEIPIPRMGQTERDQRVVGGELPSSLAGQVPLWPMTAIRFGATVEEIVLFTTPQEPQMVVSADRMAGDQENGCWAIDASVPIDEQWHGAAAVARRDAHLIGMLVFDKGHAWVVPIAELIEPEDDST